MWRVPGEKQPGEKQPGQNLFCHFFINSGAKSNSLNQQNILRVTLNFSIPCNCLKIALLSSNDDDGKYPSIYSS